jgi:hypothetical protein
MCVSYAGPRKKYVGVCENDAGAHGCARPAAGGVSADQSQRCSASRSSAEKDRGRTEEEAPPAATSTAEPPGAGADTTADASAPSGLPPSPASVGPDGADSPGAGAGAWGPEAALTSLHAAAGLEEDGWRMAGRGLLADAPAAPLVRTASRRPFRRFCFSRASVAHRAYGGRGRRRRVAPRAGGCTHMHGHGLAVRGGVGGREGAGCEED